MPDATTAGRIMPSSRWLIAVAAAALAHLALWQISEPAWLFNDFYKAYYPVAEHLWLDGTREGWPSLEVGAGGFVNLPIVGWLFVPFAPFGEPAAGWAYLAVGVAGTLAAWWLMAKHFAQGSAAWHLLALFLVNGPLINSLREGNSTHFILLFLVLGIMFWRRGRDFWAGVLFAACGIIKLPLGLLGLYFLARARWRVVAGMVAAGVVTVLLSLLVHGIEVNVGWYTDSVAPFLGGIIPAFNVQSIDGFLLRLSTGTAHLQEWLPHQPSLAHRLLRYAIVIGLLAASYWLMRRTDRTAEPARRNLVELCLVVVLALVISPISWSHYYCLLLLPAALQLGGYLIPTDEPRWRTAFWVGYALTSLPIVILPLTDNFVGELAARTVVSLWLAGGLVILAALMRSLWRLRPS